jgi:hypothetical protein
VGDSGCHSDVRQCERVTAKDAGRSREQVADAAWPDRRALAFSPHDAAPTQSEGEDLGHAEVRPHAAECNRHRRRARKPVLQGTDIGGRATHIHDHRIPKPGEFGGSPDTIGRAGGNRENGGAQRLIERHEGAAVLGQEEVGHDSVSRDGCTKGPHSAGYDPHERRVEDGGILALQQT